jgi:hypothetical protein
MLIQKSRVQSRVFNLNDHEENEAFNEVIDNPAVRVLDKRMIKHTEIEQEGRSRTETVENHMYLEWETCSL